MSSAATADAVELAAARARVHEVVNRSGTSFYWGMRLLPKAKREAMFAIYAFCREVDDIADGDDAIEAKRAGLKAWREEIERLFAGQPQHPIGHALLGPVGQFGLAKADFLAMIEGMEMDAGEGMRAPSLAVLELYCARVAGAVGHMSICVFGAVDERARELANVLGQAVQLTNVLRDLEEDAHAGRLYLPRELLDAHGVPLGPPDAALAHVRLPAVCEDLAKIAGRRFGEAEALLSKLPRQNYRPATVMMEIYRRIYRRLMERGFVRWRERVRLSSLEKLYVAVRYGLV